MTISLTSPVSCVSDDFYLYRVLCSWICYTCCHLTNQISLMMSLMMMGLNPGPLVRVIFPFFDKSVGRVIGLGSSIFFSIRVDSKCDGVTFIVFMPIGVESKGGQLIEMFWRSNSSFSSKFQNQFYSYSHGLALLHSFQLLSLHRKHDPAPFNGIHPSAL